MEKQTEHEQPLPVWNINDIYLVYDYFPLTINYDFSIQFVYAIIGLYSWINFICCQYEMLFLFQSNAVLSHDKQEE